MGVSHELVRLGAAERPQVGVHRHVPPVGREVDDVDEVHAGEEQERGRQRRVPLVHPVDRGQVERRHQHPVAPAPGGDQVDDGVGHRLGGIEVGLPREVLDLDVDEQPLAHVERLGQGRYRREAILHLGVVEGRQHRPVGRGRVVVQDQGTVPGAPHVELDAIGPEVPGHGERLQRVLRRPTPGAPVGQHERSVHGGISWHGGYRGGNRGKSRGQPGDIPPRDGDQRSLGRESPGQRPCARSRINIVWLFRLEGDPEDGEPLPLP